MEIGTECFLHISCHTQVTNQLATHANASKFGMLSAVNKNYSASPPFRRFDCRKFYHHFTGEQEAEPNNNDFLTSLFYATL
jgi:hypothetical protein